jgi:hypothetical protein
LEKEFTVEFIDSAELIELVKDHVRHILVEFSAEEPVSEEKLRHLAILAQMAASMIQHATQAVLQTFTDMPDHTAEYLYKTSKDMGSIIAKDVAKDFEPPAPVPEHPLYLYPVKGGDA